MNERDAHELRERLARIESALLQIRDHTANSWGSSLWYGMWRGAGFLIGTILIVALLSALLSALGYIPGIGDIAQHLKQTLHSQA